jgi:hypothetical protein
MSHQAIEEAITKTNSQEKRHRLLPTHLIITLVIALNLWSKDSVLDVLKNLVQGLSSSWIPKGIKWRMPSKSSISEARLQVRVIEYSILEQGEEVVYRLITNLMDSEVFPSLLLAEEYHWRWEVENTLSEFKTHLNGRKIPIRSKKGRTNPRVIKKPRSKFKGKKSLHRTGFTQLQPITFAVVPVNPGEFFPWLCQLLLEHSLTYLLIWLSF